MGLDKALDKQEELVNLKKLVVSKYHLNANELLNLFIKKKSIDARKKEDVHFVYNVSIEYAKPERILKKRNRDIQADPETKYEYVKPGTLPLANKPVIVGFGPSGIFAAYILAKQGYQPIVLERGLDVINRTKSWEEFLRTRAFNEKGSILFGEGGAGTFSDGKLTTLINDIRCDYVLDVLVKAGASEEIKYVNRPHIGTDILKKVIKNIRTEILEMGGQVLFESKLTGFVIESNKLKGVIVNGKEEISTEICLMGIGHSARDTYNMLHQNGLQMSQKPFSIGVRIEHSQDSINRVQYGAFANHPALGAADYKLSFHAEDGRSCYTFCMCPGGYVVCSSSEPEGVCTNGMSLNSRDNKNANSALLVNVSPNDFGSTHPLAGIKFQRDFEQKAFELAGKNFNAPVQLLGDYLKGEVSEKFGAVKPSYLPGTTFVDLNKILPEYVNSTLKLAIPYFDMKIKGFANEDAVLTGIETRSSSPVRITRNDEHETNIKGIYSMGEGAGYAGGIMSSAVDGIKTAEQVIARYLPLK